jgi:hypothetical protein
LVGKGAALAASGHVELEASVMEGKSLRCGAVMRLSNIKNPVQVALKGLMDPVSNRNCLQLLVWFEILLLPVNLLS